jgi:hypothetical protein
MSSFTTVRYVSEEPALKKQYLKKNVNDIEFEFGEPNESSDANNGGYVYTYYYEGMKAGKGRDMEEQYISFLFSNRDRVINIRSTTTVRSRRVSAGKIVWWTVGFPAVLIGTFVVVGVAAAASE